ncbi:MAG: hypothetical protein QOK20_1672 [Acidimicrobiaceae bacterium]|nr:hypothetical protein [Acidimicrobiaceae bacterium]
MLTCIEELAVVSHVCVHYPTGRRGQERARAASLEHLVVELVVDGVDDLIIESRTANDDRRDQTTILDTLRNHSHPNAMTYQWRSKEERLLWIADGIAEPPGADSAPCPSWQSSRRSSPSPTWSSNGGNALAPKRRVRVQSAIVGRPERRYSTARRSNVEIPNASIWTRGSKGCPSGIQEPKKRSAISSSQVTSPAMTSVRIPLIEGWRRVPASVTSV